MVTLVKQTIEFAELVCQTNFSFLTGASHPEEMVQQASDLGYRAIAITDECSGSGIVRAYAHIRKNNLKLKLIAGARFVYEEHLKLILLCPNRSAYAEMCRIITNSRKYCDKGTYLLTKWDLASVKHCIVIWLPSLTSHSQNEDISFLKKLYGSRLYIGLSRHLLAGEAKLVAKCRELSVKHKTKCVAVGSALMHDKSRLKLQHILTAIKNNCKVDELGQIALVNSEASLRPLSTIEKLFPREEIATSIEIANQCHFELDELRYEYPSELIPESYTPSRYLKKLVNSGIKKRFPEGIAHRHKQTINKELQLIEQMGYEHFFITIYDIIQFAKRKGILYQGRGSAANSIVCYCLEITAVHPDKVDVLFERFISKERSEPPDIDVDFEHHRREEVFQYLYAKYGKEHTAITATVVTYKLKSAIREVGKALGIDEQQIEFFIRNINRRDRRVKWTEQLHEVGLARGSYKTKQFIELVDSIQTFPRHLSQHVGGFVISQGPLYELVPTENAAMENRTVIQWDKEDLETLGLLKVDILALGMLTAIRRSFDLIKKHYDYDLSIANISNWGDDPQVFNALCKADTVGVFQIESRAQMSMLPRLKPRKYYDLVIQIAIVRPGPIQGNMVHPFLRRRDGVEDIVYPSSEIKGVLERTMGVPIFQEQVIKIAMVAGGFSGGEADQLRRSMGKWKYNGEMEKFRDKLISGMIANGYNSKFAEDIFEQILGFGDYGFPESHSASFAILAYVSSWLKYYFPEVFYCALLNSYPMGFYSPSQLLQDAHRRGVKVSPPCVKNSIWEHRIEVYKSTSNKSIRLGLKLIKGLKQSSAESILANRPLTECTNIYNLKKIGLSNADLERLASANALSELANNRYQARWDINNSHNDLPLFKDINSDSKHTIAIKDFDNLIEDYSSLGLSLDHHPISLLRNADLLPKSSNSKELKYKGHKSLVKICGVVTGRQSPGTAGGVTFITLEDEFGSINVIVWQSSARAQKKAFLTARIMCISGILEREKDVIHVIAGKIDDIGYLLDELKTNSRDFH